MVNIILSKKAKKNLSDLPQKEQQKVIKKLHLLENEPLAGKCLTGELKSFRSLRAWPYRILYEFAKPTVVVHRILHRQDAYK